MEPEGDSHPVTSVRISGRGPGRAGLGRKNWQFCNRVRDRALLKACLEIARDGSVMGSDQAAPQTASIWRAEAELLKGNAETEVIPCWHTPESVDTIAEEKKSRESQHCSIEGTLVTR